MPNRFDKNGIPICNCILEKIDGANIKPKSKRNLTFRDDAILTSLNEVLAKHGIPPSEDINAKFGGFNNWFESNKKIVHIDRRAQAYKSISVDSDTEEKNQRPKEKLLNDVGTSY